MLRYQCLLIHLTNYPPQMRFFLSAYSLPVAPSAVVRVVFCDSDTTASSSSMTLGYKRLEAPEEVLFGDLETG